MKQKSFKQKVAEFFQTKGFETKEKRDLMSVEELNTFAAEFKTEFGIDLDTGLTQASAEKPEDTQAAAAIIARANDILAAETDDAGDDDGEDGASASEARTTLLSTMDNLIQLVGKQKETIKTLGAVAEPHKPKRIMPAKVALVGMGNSKTHLFGVEAPLFDLSKPWNMIAARRQPLEVLAAQGVVTGAWKNHGSAFKAEFATYAESFLTRINEHFTNNTLSLLDVDQKTLAAEMDFTGFDSTGWGEQFVLRRQDALISYIRSLRSITEVFPVRFGVQDKMAMTNAFLSDISAAWQSGKVFKGGYSVEPILAEVFDAMIKHKFENMKALEREYIGYLNREGSFPIKWSMVEWLMARMSEKALNEQNDRRIHGFRVTPATGTAGHSRYASDGLIRKITKFVRDGYLARETDLNMYTSSTILAYVDSFVEKVNQIVPSLQGYYLYINEKHIPWFLRAYETANGTKLDFTGAKLEVKNYGLSGIKAVPNMGNNCTMFITLDENIEFYENVPGEMLGFYFEQDFDELLVMSTWKEGVGAYLVGKKNGTKADQFIFVNDPVTALIADATTADATVNNTFKSIANTGATVFTDFVGKSEGVLYTLTCGSATNATKTAKAALLSNIDAWIPTAVGDYLEVYWNATTSKYVEYGRKVTA